MRLRPLTDDAVIGCLTDRFHGRDGQLRARWRLIAEALATGHPLLEIVANPWQLFLLVTAYSAENSDPAELLTMPAKDIKPHL